MTFTTLNSSPLERLDRDQLLQTVRIVLAEANALSSRIAAVNEISLAINQSLDLDEILGIVAKKAKWLLDFEYCSVCLEQDDETYQIVTLFGTPTCKMTDDQLLQTPNIGYVLKTGQSLIIREGMNSPMLEGYDSQLIIPLSGRNHPIGTINFAAAKANAYTQDDLRIGYMFALQLASALTNVMHIQELRDAHLELHHYAAELEERNHELDAYNHTIAHDLKSPLSAITMKTYLLTRQFGNSATPQAQRYVDEIDSEARRMSKMIDQLLWLSRLRDASINLMVVPTQQVVEAAASRFRDALETDRIQLEIADDLPDVCGHAQWVEEVFANLFSNAIKYMAEDKTDRRISVRYSGEGRFTRFEVTDTGIGIPQDDQAHLFEMFTRVNPGRVEGLGLGLSIVHRIVTKLQGKVGVKSITGEGSTFWFTLPTASTLSPIQEEARRLALAEASFSESEG